MCVAIERALREAGVLKKELAAAFNLDKSTISHMVSDREPSFEMVSRIEQFLKLPRGKLFFEAGYVTPARSIEEQILLEQRLTRQWAQMALLQFQACVNGSASEGKVAAAVSADAASATPRLMAATS